MNLKEIIDAFLASRTTDRDAFELCPAVVWGMEYVKTKPDATAFDYVSEVEKKIADGTAGSGWLVGGLRLNWNILSEAERIALIRSMAKYGAHRTLLNKRLFPNTLTGKEQAELNSLSVHSKSVKAPNILEPIR
jgi:hypothetical protein